MTSVGTRTLQSSNLHTSNLKHRGNARGEKVHIQLHRLSHPSIQSIDAWVWHITVGETIHELSKDQLKTLRSQGWELLDLNDPSIPFLPLVSQFADTLPVALTSSHAVKTLARADAISTAREFPVILAFANQDTPPMLPGPPSQLAELGIIFDEQDKPQIYHVSKLGEEGETLCQQLREAIGMFLSLHTNDAERDASWRSAQSIARELAEQYWSYHQQILETGDSLSLLPQIDGERSLSSNKRSHRKLPPATNVLKGEPEGVSIPSDPLTQYLLQSLLDGSRYQHFENEGYVEHIPLSKDQNVRITIRPGSGEEWDSVLQSLNMLGDEVVDTFCALLAIAIDVNNEQITDPFFLDVDDILKVCQRKMSNRTFTPLQRLRVVEHLRTMTRVHITAGAPGQASSPPVGKRNARKRSSVEHGGTTLFIDSTVLDLLGTTIGEYVTLTGVPLWERRQVMIGTWAQFAPSLSKQTSIMLRKVLAYHAQRERHEKRIGRWLTLQFQVPSRRPGHVVECSTKTLLEQSGIKVNLNNAGEVRSSIEEAVERLLKDNVIGAYQRAIVCEIPRSMGTSPFDSVLGLDKDEPSFRSGVEIDSEEYWKTVRQHIRIGSAEAKDIRMRIEQRARSWWQLFAEQVVWRFEPPVPSSQIDKKLLASFHD